MTILALNGFLTEVLLRLLSVVGLIFLLYVCIRCIDLVKGHFRYKTPSLCTWGYPARDWSHNADVYNLSDHPSGDAEVRITPTDIWVVDDRHRVRKELEAGRKCVTACKYERGIFSVRVRWYIRRARQGQKILFFRDFKLPVPAGHEGDAQALVSFFNKQIEQNRRKVTLVTPRESGRAIFGEPGF